MRVLTVTGYTGSSDDHWQSHLERSDADIVPKRRAPRDG